MCHFNLKQMEECDFFCQGGVWYGGKWNGGSSRKYAVAFIEKGYIYGDTVKGDVFLDF